MRWRQVFDILDRALELAPDERVAYVAQVSNGDPRFGSAVRALLADADAASFLEAPAAVPGPARMNRTHCNGV